MKLIDTAIIGMGRMGVTRYNNMVRHGGFRVIGICDVNPKSMKNYECPKFDNWERCLEETMPEAVMVCAFNNVIVDVVCQALEMGIHVFSEKPPGRNLSDAKRMRQAALTSGKILKFGFNHRYHNSVIEAKTLIDFNLLGDVVCARGVYGKAGNTAFASDWRNNPDLSGGGILLDQGIHMLDLLCYFMGDLSAVGGLVSNLVWSDIVPEDSAFAILKTPGGKVASLHSSALQWRHKFDLDLICTDGYIALNGLLTSTQSYGEERISYYRKDLHMITGKLGNPTEHTMCFAEDNSFDYEINEFYNSLRKGAPISNGTPDDAVRVMELVESVYSKAANNA